MGKIKELRESLAKPALLYSPTDKENSSLSYFGRVSLCGPDESWPVAEDGTYLCPLLQLDLRQLPFKPKALEGCELLTLFVHGQQYPDNSPNGSDWLLKTYPKIESLQKLEQPEQLDWPVKALVLDFPILVEDYPCRDDLPETVVDELWTEFREKYGNLSGIKIGGWPSLIQSEIFWAAFNRHPAKPEYVLQVDSLEEADWYWGDSGCAYFGCGTAKGYRKTWCIDWQCF